MKKILLAILLCSLLTTSGYTETYLSDFFDLSLNEIPQDQGFQIDESLKAKYNLIAKQFAQKGITQTNIVSYETLSNGTNVHIGWYADGYIATALNGPDTGKQVISINGAIIGISYNVSYHNGYFVHYYPTSIVTSYSNCQFVNW